MMVFRVVNLTPHRLICQQKGSQPIMPHLIRKKLDGTVADRREVTPKELIVGRGDQADLKITDAEMSRAHFKVSDQGGTFAIEDLGSQNGTFVNGHRITKASLQPNDQIRAGETNFVFTNDAQPEAMPTMLGTHKPKVLR